MKKLTNLQLAELEALLKELAQEIEKSLEINAKSCATVELDQSRLGRLTRMDAMQQQKIAEASRENLKLRLKQIEAALKNIQHNDYGWCKICGEAIGYKRLKVRPESLICVDCKQHSE